MDTPPVDDDDHDGGSGNRRVRESHGPVVTPVSRARARPITGAAMCSVCVCLRPPKGLHLHLFYLFYFHKYGGFSGILLLVFLPKPASGEDG